VSDPTDTILMFAAFGIMGCLFVIIWSANHQ